MVPRGPAGRVDRHTQESRDLARGLSPGCTGDDNHDTQGSHAVCAVRGDSHGCGGGGGCRAIARGGVSRSSGVIRCQPANAGTGTISPWSLRTVQRRIRGLMDTAGVDTRIQLGWYAARAGWA